MSGCLSHTPYWGPGPKPRHGIEPSTLRFTGQVLNPLSQSSWGSVLFLEIDSVIKEETEFWPPIARKPNLWGSCRCKRRKRFNSVVAWPGRMADFCCKVHFLFLPWKKSSCPQQGQDKCQCPEFLLHFKVESFGARRQLLSGFRPIQVASWLLPVLASLLDPACGAHVTRGHAAARASWSCALGWESELASASPGVQERQRGSLVEAMSVCLLNHMVHEEDR